VEVVNVEPCKTEAQTDKRFGFAEVIEKLSTSLLPRAGAPHPNRGRKTKLVEDEDQ